VEVARRVNNPDLVRHLLMMADIMSRDGKVLHRMHTSGFVVGNYGDSE
jgi:negative regulator of sigma E activity